MHEQAERVAGGVEHHPYPIAVPIRWLPGGLGATKFQSSPDRGVEVVDLDGIPTLAIAARVGPTRLIDNVPLEGDLA